MVLMIPQSVIAAEHNHLKAHARYWVQPVCAGVVRDRSVLNSTPITCAHKYAGSSCGMLRMLVLHFQMLQPQPQQHSSNLQGLQAVPHLDGNHPTPPSVFAIGYARSLVQAVCHHGVSQSKVEGGLDTFLPHTYQVKQARDSCMTVQQAC